jgi:DTW domain
MEGSFGLDLLRLSSFEALTAAASARSQCSTCQRSRRFFCYDCEIPLIDSTKTPKVRLPVTVHIVRHAGESKSKSSVIPLKMVTDDDMVRLYKYHPSFDATLPDLSPDDTVILYPSDDSLPVDQIDWSGVKNILAVDSTWTQTRAVLDQLRSDRFRKVKLSSTYETKFWRYQDKPASCLATVEAVYLLLRDAFEATPGQFDDLLWFYKFNHDLITSSASKSKRLPLSFK